MMVTLCRKPRIVGVMGGATAPADVLSEARELGRQIAVRGHVLLTGGGPGVMEAASEGAATAGGLVLAILPHDRRRPLPGYPNPYIDLPIYTGMYEARNVINAKTSDLLIALPGASGTLSEIALALKAGTPVLALRWSLTEPAPPGEFLRLEHVEAIVAEMDRRLPAPSRVNIPSGKRPD